VPKQSAIDVPLSPSSPRRTGDTGDGGPFTGDKPVMDREQTGDGVLAPLVQRALKLFDGEVTEVRLAPLHEAFPGGRDAP
jgi:hypothetical protein